nr:hypothetical protein [Tanacetum cinerariifolium]
MILEFVENGPLIWPTIQENDVLPEVHNPNSIDNNMLNQGVQAMPSTEQSSVVNHSETEITSDSIVISYSQYMHETQHAAVQNSNSSAQQDAMILSVTEQLKTRVINCTEINLDNKSVNDTLTVELERYKEQVKVLKEGQKVDVKSQDNVLDSHEQNAEIDRLKQTLSEQLKEKESLMKTVIVLKNDFKNEESRNIGREIVLEKTIKRLDNIVYKIDQSAQTVHMLAKPKFFYDHTTKQALETLIFDEESRSKMLLKQQDPMVLEKKDSTKPNSINSSQPSPSYTPTKFEVPKELPKVSMVNTSLKKSKHHLAGFDMFVKARTMVTTITEGTWEFEHTKACFRDEIIPFVKEIKDIFNKFDQYLIDELTEVQNIFIQIEQAVEQHHLESKKIEVKMNQALNENDRLLEQVINKDIVNIVVNSSVDNVFVNVHKCKKCLKLETEDNSVSNQRAPNFDQYFELNKLKAQSQEKDTVIRKLKERIKSLSGNVNKENVKKDINEIETINIELEHSVAKLISENKNVRNEREHLKLIFKDQFDSIKKARVQLKEHCDSLIAQINVKSVENSDLNAQLQDNVFEITTLKEELRKLKGKCVVDYAVSKSNAITISLGILR